MLELAMLGMVEGNGHPFSWSAIINGRYDGEFMSKGGYPGIAEYLSAAPKELLGIDDAKVTHVWCDDPKDTEKVAKAAYIPNAVASPEEVIGKVDAVIIATDKGWEHIDRARPFIEADVPVFIDKPLTDQEDHLRQFAQWQSSGKKIMSTSAMRYAKEFVQARKEIDRVGELRLITNTTPKSWERYGIHALEGVYPFLEPGGWLSVSNSGNEEANMVHCCHESGVEVVLAAIADMYGSLCSMGLHGTKGNFIARYCDTCYAFRTQLVEFVNYLKTGQLPFDFSETIELMKIIIAGIRSRQEDGRTVNLSEIKI